MRPNAATALAVALALGAACIDKPPLPSERGDGRDGGADDDDGGPIDGDGGPCDPRALDDPTPWADSDQIRFDRDSADLNSDCLDDLAIPGERVDQRGVFVVLGREENMLTGGFDGFVDTGERIPVDVQLTHIVGDDQLDLIVLAREGDADDSPTVLVFAGDGQGGFDDDYVENNAAGIQLAIGTIAEPGPLFIHTLQLEEGAEVSLQYGDATKSLSLSPDDWNSPVDVSSADAVVMADVAIDSLTDVFQVESGTSGAEDFVVLDDDELDWYAYTGPADFSENFLATADFGVGRAAFGDIDANNDSDIVYSRNQGVFASLLSPPGAAGNSGASVELPFIPDPAIAGVALFDDIQITQIDGLTDDLGDLVLLAVDGAGTAEVWVYPNLDREVDDLVNRTRGDSASVLGTTSTPRNRIVTGHFHDPEIVDFLLYSSEPGVQGAICLRPSIEMDMVTLELCTDE